MKYKVLVHKNAFDNIPENRIIQIKKALKTLEDPLRHHDKCAIVGKTNVYRLRIGKYRAFYGFRDENTILVDIIITQEQAHKIYDR